MTRHETDVEALDPDVEAPRYARPVPSQGTGDGGQILELNPVVPCGHRVMQDTRLENELDVSHVAGGIKLDVHRDRGSHRVCEVPGQLLNLGS